MRRYAVSDGSVTRDEQLRLMGLTDETVKTKPYDVESMIKDFADNGMHLVVVE